VSDEAPAQSSALFKACRPGAAQRTRQTSDVTAAAWCRLVLRLDAAENRGAGALTIAS
jgi:hypothetical protein